MGQRGAGCPQAGRCARSRDSLTMSSGRVIGIGNDDQRPHAGNLQVLGMRGPPVAGSARIAGRRQGERPQPVNDLLTLDHDDCIAARQVGEAVEPRRDAVEVPQVAARPSSRRCRKSFGS